MADNRLTYHSQCIAERIPHTSFRGFPLSLMRKDLALLVKNSRYIKNIVLPFRNTLAGTIGPDKLPTKANWWTSAWGTFEQAYLLAFSILGIAASSTMLLVKAPAPAGVLAVTATAMGFWMQTKVFQSKVHKHTTVNITLTKEHSKEEWLYINGICTGSSGIQESVNFLSSIFHRPITGIHNKTNGLLLDLGECFIQREFGYATQDGSIVLYEELKNALLNEKKERVILIAHSQGAIIASIVLDWLLSDIPQKNLLKLEVYTFANAANHFNSPITFKEADGTSSPIIKHVEHFVNGKDFVPRIGILAWGRTARWNGDGDTRYYGSLFQRPEASGHSLIKHYLQANNPSEHWPADSEGNPARLWSYLKGGTPEGGHEPVSI